MKAIVLALLLALLPGQLCAAIAIVQGEGAVSSGAQASLGTTLDSNVTAGNTIMAGGICDSAGLCIGSGLWSDGVNSYVFLGDGAGSGALNVARAVNGSTASRTVTLTPTASEFMGIYVMELSGVATTSPDDGQAEDTHSDIPPTSSVVSPGTIVTTTAGLVFAVANVRSATTITQDGTWILLYEDESYSVFGGSFIYKMTTAGSQSPTWTLGANSQWYSTAVALKEQPVVTGVARRRIINVP